MSARIAFLLGSNGPAWSQQLRFANADVERIADCLSAHCGFDVRVTSDTLDAYDTLRLLDSTIQECGPEDVFVVYFSGHGELSHGQLMLLLSRTSESLIGALPASSLLHSLRLCRARMKLLILDCCHAGAASGFKGQSAPLDIVTARAEDPSQLILFASNRIERAREFEELRGSFLAAAVAEILSNTIVTRMTLLELVEHLQERARTYNSRASRPVPVPYLFGEMRGQLLLKQPSRPSPVQIAFRSLSEPDVELLRNTLGSYEQWQSVNILHHMPVSIEFAPAISDRLQVLERYVVTDHWPCLVAPETKIQIRELTESVLGRIRHEIITAVRLVAAAAIDQDGGIHRTERDETLKYYLKAKALAFVRLLMAFRLKGEVPDPWMEEFFGLEDTWSTSVLAGITLVAQKPEWLFWVDADYHQRRLYVPQSGGGTRADLKWFGKDVVLRALLPQYVDWTPRPELSEVRGMLTCDPLQVWASLSMRGESFISTDIHNSPEYARAKKRAQYRFVDAVVRRLGMLSKEEQCRALENLTVCSWFDEDEVLKATSERLSDC